MFGVVDCEIRCVGQGQSVGLSLGLRVRVLPFGGDIAGKRYTVRSVFVCVPLVRLL